MAFTTRNNPASRRLSNSSPQRVLGESAADIELVLSRPMTIATLKDLVREKDREARELQEKNVRTAELIRDQIERMKERFEREKADLIQNGLPKGDDTERRAEEAEMKLAALTDKFREIYNSFKEATKQAEQLKEKKAELESELKTLKGTNSILTQALTATEKKLQVAPPFASSKNSQKPQDRSMSATASFVSSKSGKGAVFDFQEQIQQLVDEKNSKDDEIKSLRERLAEAAAEQMKATVYESEVELLHKTVESEKSRRIEAEETIAGLAKQNEQIRQKMTALKDKTKEALLDYQMLTVMLDRVGGVDKVAKLATKVRHLEASLENERVLVSVEKAKLKGKDTELQEIKAELSRIRTLFENARNEVAELKVANSKVVTKSPEELTLLHRERKPFAAKLAYLTHDVEREGSTTSNSMQVTTEPAEGELCHSVQHSPAHPNDLPPISGTSSLSASTGRAAAIDATQLEDLINSLESFSIKEIAPYKKRRSSHSADNDARVPPWTADLPSISSRSSESTAVAPVSQFPPALSDDTSNDAPKISMDRALIRQRSSASPRRERNKDGKLDLKPRKHKSGSRSSRSTMSVTSASMEAEFDKFRKEYAHKKSPKTAEDAKPAKSHRRKAIKDAKEGHTRRHRVVDSKRSSSVCVKEDADKK